MRAFSMFPELDITAVIWDVSTHLHFRLVGHQLMADATKVNVFAELFVDVTCSALGVL